MTKSCSITGQPAGRLCNCVGPQDGQPLCPCQMGGLIMRDGNWIRPEKIVAPVRPFRQPETNAEKIARLRAEIADIEAKDATQ